jgi:hypothetical protein
MPVRCIFHVAKHPQPCQVLKALGAPALSGRTRQGLEQRYCHCGSFVCCPIFQRVEERLESYDEQVRVPAVA